MLADGRTSRQTIARLRLTYIQPMACCLFHKNTKNFVIVQLLNIFAQNKLYALRQYLLYRIYIIYCNNII